MDKYTFNHSGDELLELVTMAIISCGTLSDNLNARMFFDEKYALQSIGNLLLSGRIYSNKENYINLVNKVVRREPDVISDMQKIIMILRTPSDIEGNRLLFNILKGINKNKIAKDIRDFEIKRLYSHFLYKNGYAGSGFRVDDVEINKTLLLRLLEAERPDEYDFKILVESAGVMKIPDEDIEKIYNMLKYKSESDRDYLGKINYPERLAQIQKYFAPVQKRLEIKKQQQSQSAEPETSDEYEPKTLEEALALIQKLREAKEKLAQRNAVLEGIIKASQLQNQGGGNTYVPQERVVQTI